MSHFWQFTWLWRIKWLLLLLCMLLIDFSPIPLSALAFLYIFFFKPRWFKRVIDRLYSE